MSQQQRHQEFEHYQQGIFWHLTADVYDRKKEGFGEPTNDYKLRTKQQSPYGSLAT